MCDILCDEVHDRQRNANTGKKHSRGKMSTTMSETKTTTELTPGMSTKAKLQFLARLLRKEKGWLSIALGAVVVSSASNLLAPKLLGWIVDATAPRDRAVAGKTALGAFALGAAASYLRVYAFGVLKLRVSEALREGYFEDVLSSGIEFFDDAPAEDEADENENGKVTRIGEMVSAARHDCDVLASAVSNNLASLLRSCNSALGQLIMCAVISPQLTVVSLMSLPVVGIVAMVYAKKRKRVAKVYEDGVTAIVNGLHEKLTNIATVKAFGQENRELASLKGELGDANKLALLAASADARFRGGLDFGIKATLVAVMFCGSHHVSSGSLTPGGLTAFSLHSMFAGLGFGGISGACGDILKALGSCNRYFQIRGRAQMLRAVGDEKHDDIPPTTASCTLHLQDVSFSYPSRASVDVLKSLTMTMESGDVVALSGPSGSGKSTIASLILGLRGVKAGTITYGGKDISSFDMSLWRKLVSYVRQEPVLFAASIRDNIRYAFPDATDEAIITAAKEACCHDFIVKLPEGYDTILAEGTRAQLSIGQKQRIAIARAIVCSPRILIMDEAFSALDGKTTSDLQRAVGNAMKGRTTLLISHRRSTLRAATKVFVLDTGRVVAQGTFAELMSKPNGHLPLLLAERRRSLSQGSAEQ